MGDGDGKSRVFYEVASVEVKTHLSDVLVISFARASNNPAILRR